MSEECVELQNIKYQTMLLSGNSKVISNKVDSNNIGAYLERENAENRKKSWSKLGKASKMRKLSIFIGTYATEKNLTKQQKSELRCYLLLCLERKKLQRVKDVIYDVEAGIVKNIPGLSYDKIRSKFTLKRASKKRATLKGLAPTKKRRDKN